MKGIWTYSHLLPSLRERCKLTLGEGNTPLLRSKRLGAMLGLENLYFKLELLNPTGSYKDRFAASAVSELVQQESPFCMATSSGNTGAALAAYCAAASIRCFVAIVDGAPSGKIQQMHIYGAETMMIKDFGISTKVSNEVFSGLQALASRHRTLVQVSAYKYSPIGMAGVQTIAYEIAEDLPADVSVHVFCPAGGGGLTLAVAKGFKIWEQAHPGYEKPKVHCVQPAGNDTISGALRDGSLEAQKVFTSTTSISGLQVPNVIDGNEVIVMCRAGQGTGLTVTDELIYECQKSMALNEGIFCEPAGAVALAGVIKAFENKEVSVDDHIVCLVTGHGFKDAVSTEKIAGRDPTQFFSSSGDTWEFIEMQLQRKQI